MIFLLVPLISIGASPKSLRGVFLVSPLWRNRAQRPDNQCVVVRADQSHHTVSAEQSAPGGIFSACELPASSTSSRSAVPVVWQSFAQPRFRVMPTAAPAGGRVMRWCRSGQLDSHITAHGLIGFNLWLLIASLQRLAKLLR